MLNNFENEYDWTLVYHVITKEQIDKKKLISQFNVILANTQKYGPIGSISVKLGPLNTNPISVPGAVPAATANDGLEDKLGTVKIKYLAVRNSW